MFQYEVDSFDDLQVNWAILNDIAITKLCTTLVISGT